VSGRPPNILLVMADQLTPGILPAYGNRVVRAPAIARLAAEGTVFESAYCASPLCAPSRYAMLAGRRPSAIGAFDNAAELPAATPTIAHLLRAAGYDTVLAGKMHFVGPDQLHGFERRLTTDVYPAGFDWTPDWGRPPSERAGWYHSIQSILDSGVREAALQTDYDDEVCFRAVRELRHQSVTARGRPFFLTVSFTNPHDPWEVRPAHWGLYDGVDVGSPAVPPIPRGEADPASVRLRDMYGIDERPLSSAEEQRARRAYMAAVSYADDRVGEVLDALEQTGLAGSTLVVLTSDHGEMLGERGMWFKMSWFENSARIPMIVHAPKRFAPRRVAASVSQVDILPTLVELANDGRLPAAVVTDGHSLVPYLTGAQGHDGVIGEYTGEGASAPVIMIRRGSFKFIHCPTDPDQLYDVSADPLEKRNLVGDPAQAARVAALRKEIAEGWDLDALRKTVIESQRRRRFLNTINREQHVAWDYQPMADASAAYIRNTVPIYELEARSRFPMVKGQ
jgi:choline-sulfatase